MKKIVVKILSAVVVMAVCIGCGGGGDRMRITVEGSGEISFSLSGSGMATVDWGDGSDRTTLELNERGTRFSKVYASSGRHTITITGNDMIGLGMHSERLISLDVRRNPKLKWLNVSGKQLTSLDLRNNAALTSLTILGTQLTNLDLSRNTALTGLGVRQGQLTNLDLSRNTALTWIDIQFSQLTTSALNALFESLPPASGENNRINIGYNPGTNDANRSIAEAKGWRVTAHQGW